jgi:large subunit ribosomal protein L32
VAVPKRRKTKSKARMRRAQNWRLHAPTYSSCPHCRQPKLPHRVCQNCGYYAGRQAVETE